MKTLKVMTFMLLLFCFGKADAQQDFSKLDKWLADNAQAMGGRDILLIYKMGHIVYSHAEDNMSAQEKMINRFVARRQGKTADMDGYSPTTQTAIASCSKWLSAALVMTFVDEGKLKLTDTVGKYLPILSWHGKGGITIADCLSHLTGINPPPLKEDIRDNMKLTSMDESIQKIAEMPMEGAPGTVFHYSGAGLQICGAIIEKLSSQSFDDVFKERIAGPVNMPNTDFGHTKVVNPAGGAYSTPNDYLNFLVMILNKGAYNGKRILSEKSIAAMQINRVAPDVKIGYTPAQISGFGYGYGEWTMGTGVVTSPGLFGSIPWVDNNNHYAAFLMTFYLNNAGRDQRFKDLKQLVDEAVGK